MVVQEDVRLERSEKEVWVKAREILARKLHLPTFEMWVGNAQLIGLSADEAVIGVSNSFVQSYIQKNVLPAIQEAITEVIVRRVKAKTVIDSSICADSYTPSLAAITVLPVEVSRSEPTIPNHPVSNLSASTRITSASLNSKYTFDSFVIGSHNRFVHSAALAVAERPGQSYNPLFIYGGVGLGKTHIMQAIGHQILLNSPQMTVRYMSCERFTNELINSIRDDRMVEFRKRYRQIDVLLMDDIQFIERKESTQEEFFHTFNALRDSGRQIVLSSDRPPKSLSLLEERLRSRFEWGLIADIQTPDLETRTAILRKKCELDKLQVPDDVLEYIASIFTNNIRELEGALIRAHAYSDLTRMPLTPATVAGVLQPGGPIKAKPVLTMDKIIEAVASHYRVETSELRSAKRSQDLALPRHLAMYLANQLLQMSYPRIGQAFGNRKHTSAIYAVSRIQEMIACKPEIAEAVKQITRQLGG